jgi:hypothetical protein
MKRIIEKNRPAGIKIAEIAKLGCAAVLIILGACKREEPVTALDMPTTPVLTVRANWGVVTSPYLRIRRQPRMDGDVVAHLRNSSIAEILAKTTYPETVEGQTNYWYEISSDGLRGWVFGSYLEFFDSRSKAEQAARTSTNG